MLICCIEPIQTIPKVLMLCYDLVMGNSDKVVPDSEHESLEATRSEAVSAGFSHPHEFSRLLKKVKLTSARVIIVVIIAFLVGGSLVYLYKQHVRNAESVCSKGKNAVVLTQAVAAFETHDIPLQQQLVAKIKTFPNYQKDPNCLYIAINYYDNSYNLNKAQQDLAQFNKIYTGNPPLNSILTNFETVQMMRHGVVELQTTLKQDQHNMIGIPSRL